MSFFRKPRYAAACFAPNGMDLPWRRLPADAPLAPAFH